MKCGLFVAALTPLLLTASANTDSPETKEDWPRPLFTLRGHTDRVFCVRYSPDGTRLASGSWDAATALWDAATGNRLCTLAGNEAVTGVGFSSGGDRLVTGYFRGDVTIWDLRKSPGTPLVQFKTGGLTVYDVAWCGKSLATAGRPPGGQPGGWSGLKVWDSPTGQRLPGFAEPGEAGACVAYSPDGRRLAAGGLYAAVSIWEVASGHRALTLRGHDKGVRGLAWGPNGRRLATGGMDGTVTLWALPSGKMFWRSQRHEGPVWGVCFTHDGGQLFSAANRKTEKEVVSEVRAWNTTTGEGKMLLQVSQQANGVYSVALSPDGTRLATAHGDGTVRIWSVRQLLGQRGVR